MQHDKWSIFFSSCHFLFILLSSIGGGMSDCMCGYLCVFVCGCIHVQESLVWLMCINVAYQTWYKHSFSWRTDYIYVCLCMYVCIYMCIYKYFINLNICHRYESIVLEYLWVYDYIDLECIWIVYINKKNKKNRINVFNEY